MENDKTIAALNKLLEINNDRIEGYDTASKETDAADLKMFFATLTTTSRNCQSELTSEIARLGGQPVEGTKVTGKFFRAWMDVKAALTGGDRHAILASCEFGEDKAQETYDEVMEDRDNGLTSDQLAMVRKQQASLRGDHDKVKSLRDAAA